MKNLSIDSGKEFDFGFVSEDYAKFRDIYPEEFYRKISDYGYFSKGHKVLDLGTGTGVLPRNMSKYGAEFTGVDISENQIAYAKILTNKAGLDIKYIVSSAEVLDFSEKVFDTVTACQCFMYFDKKIVIPKIHSWLKDNGHFLVLFMVWLPFESEIAMKSEDLVLKYNPEWSGGRIARYEQKEPAWAKELFIVDNMTAFDVDIMFTRETWHGRMKTCRGIGASCLSSEKIKEWELEHINYLNTVPESFTIPHYATVLDLRKK